MLIADPSFGAVCQLSFGSLILMGLLWSVVLPPRDKPAPARLARRRRRSSPLIGEEHGQPAALLGLRIEPAAEIGDLIFLVGDSRLGGLQASRQRARFGVV